MNTIYIAIALFAVSAVLGLSILIKWLTNKSASKGVIYSHGIVAAAALVTLIAYAFNNPDNFPKISLALFLISAIVGFYMFFRDLQHKMSPMGVAVSHATVAVLGFVALLVFAFA
jgi:hypothetical protein